MSHSGLESGANNVRTERVIYIYILKKKKQSGVLHASDRLSDIECSEHHHGSRPGSGYASQYTHGPIVCPAAERARKEPRPPENTMPKKKCLFHMDITVAREARSESSGDGDSRTRPERAPALITMRSASRTRAGPLDNTPPPATFLTATADFGHVSLVSHSSEKKKLPGTAVRSEDCVETHICKLRMLLRSRTLRRGHALTKYPIYRVTTAVFACGDLP